MVRWSFKYVFYFLFFFLLVLCGLHCRRKTSHFTSTRQVNLRARYPANSNDSTYIQSKITLKTLDGGFLKFNETLLQWYLLFFCFFVCFCCCMEYKNIRNQVGFSFYFVSYLPFHLGPTIPAILQTMKGFFLRFFYLLTRRLSSVTIYLSLFLTRSTVILFLNWYFLLCVVFFLSFLSDLSCAVVLCFLYNSTSDGDTQFSHTKLRTSHEIILAVRSIFYFGVIYCTSNIFFLFHCIRRLHATKMMKWLRIGLEGSEHYFIQYIYR